MTNTKESSEIDTIIWELQRVGDKEPNRSPWSRPHARAERLLELAKQLRRTPVDIASRLNESSTGKSSFDVLVALHAKVERTSLKGLQHCLAELFYPELPQAGEIFAREVLMPEDEIKGFADNDGAGNSVADSNRLAANYGLPVTTVLERLDELGIDALASGNCASRGRS